MKASDLIPPDHVMGRISIDVPFKAIDVEAEERERVEAKIAALAIGSYREIAERHPDRVVVRLIGGCTGEHGEAAV